MVAYKEADNATELRVTFHTLRVTFHTNTFCNTSKLQSFQCFISSIVHFGITHDVFKVTCQVVSLIVYKCLSFTDTFHL